MKKYIGILLSAVMLIFTKGAYAEEDSVQPKADTLEPEVYVEILPNVISDENALSESDVIMNFDNEDTQFFQVDDNVIFGDEQSDDSEDEIGVDDNSQDFVQQEQNMDFSVQIMSLSSDDSWTVASNMTAYRADADLINIDGVLYAIGGIGTNGYLYTIERYNSTSSVWQILTTIPNEIKGFSAVSDGEKIYIIGGYNNGEYLNTVEVYDIAENEWTSGISMKEKRDQAAALYMENKIYVFGGRNDDGFVNSYEFYDLSENKWNLVTTKFDDSMIRVGANVKLIEGYICMYGGIDTNYSSCGIDIYWILDLKDRSTLMTGGYDDISIAWGEDKALVFANNGSASERLIKEMTIDIDGTAEFSDMVFENSAPGGKYSGYIMYNGYLYCVGGYNTSSKSYLKSTYTYSVYYGEHSVGDYEINNAVASNGNSIILNVEEGQTYTIFINCKNVTSFDGYKFNVDYADNSFSVEDGCAFTLKKDGTGFVQNTDIVITDIDSNGISFECNEELPVGMKSTKTVNAVILKANSTGHRKITYSMTAN